MITWALIGYIFGSRHVHNPDGSVQRSIGCGCIEALFWLVVLIVCIIAFVQNH